MKNFIDFLKIDYYEYLINCSNEEKIKREFFIKIIYDNLKDFFENKLGNINLDNIINNYDLLLKEAEKNSFNINYLPDKEGIDHFGKKIIYHDAEVTYFHQDILKSYPDFINKEREELLRNIVKLGYIEQFKFMYKDTKLLNSIIKKEELKFKKETKKEKLSEEEIKNKELVIQKQISSIYNSIINIKDFYLINGWEYYKDLNNEEDFIKLIKNYTYKYNNILEKIRFITKFIDSKYPNEDDKINKYIQIFNNIINYLEKNNYTIEYKNYNLEEKKTFNKEERKNFIEINKNHFIVKLLYSSNLIENNNEEYNKTLERIKKYEEYKELNKNIDKSTLEKINNIIRMLKEDLNKYKDYNPLFQDLLDLTFLHDDYIVYKKTITTILENNNCKFSLENIKNGKIKDLSLFEEEIEKLYNQKFKNKYNNITEFKIYLYKIINKNLKNNLINYLSIKKENQIDNNLNLN